MREEPPRDGGWKGVKLGLKSLHENYAKAGKAHGSSEEEPPRRRTTQRRSRLGGHQARCEELQREPRQGRQGLKGTKLRVKSLNENYAKAGKAHGSSGDANGGIVGILHVIKSDFTKEITEKVAAERGSRTPTRRRPRKTRSRRTLSNR